jgi:hypothetical protein
VSQDDNLYQAVHRPTQPDGFEDASATVLSGRVQGDVADRFVLQADGSLLVGDGTAVPTDPVEAAIAPARTTWAAAGGSDPFLTGLDAGALPASSGTPFTVGTDNVADSSWNAIGKEAFWSLRIVAGTGAAGTAADQWALGGLPVAPKMTTGHGRVIGQGFLLDAEDNYHMYPVMAVIDPFYSLTLPVLFYGTTDVATTDPAGLNSAASTGAVTTDTPEVVLTHTVLGGTYFGAGTGIALGSTPFDFGDGCILNLSGQFETV